MSDAEYRLLVSFADVYETMPEEHAFVHGYECGRIAGIMEQGADFERTVHAINETILRRMCAADGYTVSFEPTEPPVEGWLQASFKWLPHKKHLAVIK